MFKQLVNLIVGIQNKNRQQNTDIKNYRQDQRLAAAGGVSPIPATPNPAPPLQQSPFFQKIMSLFNKPAQATSQGTPVNVPLQKPVMTPTPTPTPGWEPYKKAYDKFYADRGNPPIASMTGMMAKLTYDNPNLRRNPGVVAGIPVLESSGGKNVTYNNNPVNWGIQLQKKGQFNPSSWDESVTKMATGLDHRQVDYTPNKLLDTWRQTGDLNALGEWYAPSSDNPQHGGKVYGQRLADMESEIKSLLRSFGVQ